MNKRRGAFLEVVALTALAFYLLNRDQLPTLTLVAQRAAVHGCQLAARGFGTLALKLEANYKVRVAP
jgi:hypothetical protein